MTWSWQRDDRSIRRDGPAGSESQHWRAVEIKKLRDEASRNGSSHWAHQTSRKTCNGLPLRSRDPNTVRGVFGERTDVITMQMCEEHAIEVVRLEAEASQFESECLPGRDVEFGSRHAAACTGTRASVNKDPFVPSLDDPGPHWKWPSEAGVAPDRADQSEWSTVRRTPLEKC